MKLKILPQAFSFFQRILSVFFSTWKHSLQVPLKFWDQWVSLWVKAQPPSPQPFPWIFGRTGVALGLKSQQLVTSGFTSAIKLPRPVSAEKLEMLCPEAAQRTDELPAKGRAVHHTCLQLLPNLLASFPANSRVFLCYTINQVLF